MTRREDFPGTAEDALPLEGIEVSTVLPRFDPNQRRAFGSVPGLLGKNIDVPPFHRLDELALRRIEPTTLRRGLYGVQGNNAVKGLALNTQQYEVIVRNHKSFSAAIRNKTLAAQATANDIRAREAELRSVAAALDNKAKRHETVLAGLSAERETLAKLADWQKTPGYWRTREVELRVLATSAWEGSFTNILKVVRDQHELSPEEYIDMANALAYRLTKGPQDERMKSWGGMLGLALDYNKSVGALFNTSAHQITSDHAKIETKLDEFYEQYAISRPDQ